MSHFSKTITRALSFLLACVLCASCALSSFAQTGTATLSEDDYQVIAQEADELAKKLGAAEDNNRIYTATIKYSKPIPDSKLPFKVLSEITYFLALSRSTTLKSGYYLRGEQVLASSRISDDTIQMHFTYYTTPEQEREINSWSQKTASNLVNSRMTNSEKLSTIYRYVTSHFDYKNVDSLSQSMYSGMTRGTMICTGFAQMIYMLAHYAGVPNVGIEAGAYKTGSNNGHCWNTYTDNGVRYVIDGTGDYLNYFFGFQYKPNSYYLMFPSTVASRRMTDMYTPYVVNNYTYRLVV